MNVLLFGLFLRRCSQLAALSGWVFTLLAAGMVEACACTSKVPSPNEAFAKASLVALGKVGTVRPDAFEFVVEAQFKGAARESFEVKNEGACRHHVTEGAPALVYLRESRGSFRVDACDAHQRLILGWEAEREAQHWSPSSQTSSAASQLPAPMAAKPQIAPMMKGGLFGHSLKKGNLDFGGPLFVERRERYADMPSQPILQAKEQPVSTFSIDVDTGSYSNVRRFINEGQLPPKEAVRVEELINYFSYQYPHASKEHPFGVSTEVAPCPWNSQHQLLKIAIAAEDVSSKPMPPANLVFLIDVSGSMDALDKLPLLKSSLLLLVEQLRAVDRVSLVTYAGNVAVVLEPTRGNERAKIRSAIEQLGANGSTNGAAGIELAYKMAWRGFINEGINRVLLATDGDFNVGLSDTQSLKKMLERERATGVSLSTLGFGTGNYNDEMMEQIADVGNGNYSYIDSLQEGHKVLVEQMRSTLQTVAKDVKIQVEFNPTQILEYRLLGYENRMLKREDFNNDAMDAGEVGAGSTVTALYEVTPVGAAPSVDPLRYAEEKKESPAISENSAHELAFVRVRYKTPEGTKSLLMESPVLKGSGKPRFSDASLDFRFASAVAAFGNMLQGNLPVNYDQVVEWASQARGTDENGNRSEFVKLVRLAKSLRPSEVYVGQE